MARWTRVRDSDGRGTHSGRVSRLEGHRSWIDIREWREAHDRRAMNGGRKKQKEKEKERK